MLPGTLSLSRAFELELYSPGGESLPTSASHVHLFRPPHAVGSSVRTTQSAHIHRRGFDWIGKVHRRTESMNGLAEMTTMTRGMQHLCDHNHPLMVDHRTVHAVSENGSR